MALLGLCGGSESGKTEFLRWIFNYCCTFIPNDKRDNTATDLLRKINAAIPQGQKEFDNRLVLFASFNQTSTYVRDEGPILSTTMERLLRSFSGDIVMHGPSSWKVRRFQGFSCVEHIMDHFDKGGNTGYIYCIDELSNLKDKNPDEYQRLMESLLSSSQIRLANGGFCAIVGSALSILDIGEVVIQGSNRSFLPIQFPAKNPEMAQKALDFVHHKTDVFKGAENSRETEEFYARVTISLLESSASLREWDHIMDMQPTSTRVRPPSISCGKSDNVFSYDDIFLMVAQGLFERDIWSALDKVKLDELVNRLGGSVAMKPTPNGIVRRINDQMGQMILPAWRLLEFPTIAPQMFTWVRNWVIVETRKLFYEYGPAESQKMWELATMGVLELRRAMLMACSVASGKDVLPTLGEIVQGLNVHHNVANDLMEAVSSPVAAQNKNTRDLATDATKTSKEPCFFYSAIENEKGIEGVFKAGFDTCEHAEICLFFQMKMYSAATPQEISKWPGKADDRAKELGCKTGSYIIQLFVTGVKENNIQNHKDSWPNNCMVFGSEALTNLFEPFGKGIIEEIIRIKSRDKS